MHILSITIATKPRSLAVKRSGIEFGIGFSNINIDDDIFSLPFRCVIKAYMDWSMYSFIYISEKGRQE